MQYHDGEGRDVATIGRVYYVDADEDGYDGAFQIHHDGVAWQVYGWEVEPTEGTEWDGIMVRTGRLVAVMVGDDRPEILYPEDLTRLQREDYCGECGQIGCRHDGLDREESVE